MGPLAVDGWMPVHPRLKVRDYWDEDSWNTTLLLDLVGEAKTEEILTSTLCIDKVWIVIYGL